MSSTGATAAPVKDGTSGCGPVELVAELPAPPAGFVSYQETAVDDECSIVHGPIIFLPKSGGTEFQARATQEQLPTISDLSSGVSIAAAGSVSTHSRVWDPVGTLTLLHTDTSWSWDGSTVTGYVSGGYIEWHSEDVGDLFGVGGWRPTNAYNVLDSGCRGCAFVKLHAHAAFGYQGLFDPLGMFDYRNTHDNWTTVNKNGTWSCHLTLDSTNFLPWWTWSKTCG